MVILWQAWWNALGIALATGLGVVGLTALANRADKALGATGWLTGSVAVATTLIAVGLLAGAIVFGK